MSREIEHENGYTEMTEKIGEVKLADDVVATIAGLAATEIDGVASMQGNLTNEIVGKLGIRNLSKGVKIELCEGSVQVELSLIMKYGFSIPETCKAVQDRVKSAIENMTGLHVECVDIHVAGVNTEVGK